jgi:pyruvate dehydrogenase E2 component (dihydrolipoamide acetyltransferase)
MAAIEGVDLDVLEGSGPAGKITRQDVRRFLESQVKPDGAPVHPNKVRATPGARRVAKEHQIDLMRVIGTGFQGRIQGNDVQAYLEQQKTAAGPALEQVLEAPHPTPQVFEAGKAPTVIHLDRMRLTIGQRMQVSVQQIPHIMLSIDIDMSRAVSMRAALNTRIPTGQPQISMTAVLVKACAAALHENPNLNSYLLGDQLHVYPDANVGVAVALEGGLIVPVVHQASEKSLFQVGAEIADLSKRARDGKLKPEDVDGGTFTLSNLGMFGIDHFTAIINPPQVAILAAGQISRRFIPDEEGKAVVRSMMTVTLSVDHRVIDGAGGARFLNTLRDILETAGSQWG